MLCCSITSAAATAADAATAATAADAATAAIAADAATAATAADAPYGAGLVLRGGIHPDLYPEMVLERPKVIYNEKQGTFVMWMHIDELREEARGRQSS